MHAFLYHLCLKDLVFRTDSGLNLVHAEYPTPFKCSMGKAYTDFEIKNISSNFTRSHIDMVLINPNFIKWIETNSDINYRPIEYIKGLRNEKFETYIKQIIDQYRKFYEKTNEAILLFAIEFKYIRGGYEGIKAPLNSLKQDIEKLKTLQFIPDIYSPDIIKFAENIKVLCFIHYDNRSLEQKIREDSYMNAKENKPYYEVIYRNRQTPFQDIN